ncbi:MAG: branched-chain amino acid ABC transporter permease [Candidatus Kariarchaeaceae archaeon]|jgi:neutral amino acid transport system permease protein
MEEREIFERSMATDLSFTERYRSLILALIFAVPVVSLFLYPVVVLGSGTRYFLDTFSFVFLFAAMALTLNLEIGYLGLPNFGKVAFVMIGAYAYAMVGVAGWSLFGLGTIITGLIVATVVTGFAGVLLTLPTLRLREDYFAIVTIVAGEILRMIANNEETFGGFSGFPVTNFVFAAFNPDDTLSGRSLFGQDIFVVLGVVVISAVLYTFFKKRNTVNFDDLKSTKYALQSTIGWATLLTFLGVFFNFRQSFHDYSSIALDMFLISFLAVLYVVKFVVNFISGIELDNVVFASLGIFAIIATISYLNGDPTNPGTTEINNVNWYFMLVTAVVMIIVYYAMEAVYHSPFGRALRAVREDDTSAMSIGKSLFGLRLRGLIVSNALTGFVSAFYAMVLFNISPQAFLPLLTFQLYIMVIIGGTGNNKGVIFGAIVVQLLIQATRRLSSVIIYYPFFTSEDIFNIGRKVNPFNLALIIVGVTLVIFLIYAPEGIFPEKRDNNESYKDLLYLIDEDEVILESNPVLKLLMTASGADKEDIFPKEEFT